MSSEGGAMFLLFIFLFFLSIHGNYTLSARNQTYIQQTRLAAETKLIRYI